MLAGVIIVVLISMAMVMLRVIVGPSVFDRILGANSFGSHVVVFIVLLGLFDDASSFIDIAIIYGLISFIATIAFLMYFKYKPEED